VSGALRRDFGLAMLAGVVAAVVCWLAFRLPPPTTSDFDQLWVAARALLAGLDPYAVVPTTGTHFPFYYPLPAALVVVPLAGLPLPAARVAWAFLSGAIFAWAALRRGGGLLPALLSASFLNAVVQGQLSPLLTAAVIIPGLNWVWVTKPSIGAAMFAGYPSRRAVIGGLVFIGVAVLVSPSWPLRWLDALRDGSHLIPPVARPGGILLLLALIRWRIPEARLLVGLACVPQTLGLYETLPLFLIARTRWQGYALAALSYLAAFTQVIAAPRVPGMTLEATFDARWPYSLICLYLPALVLLLLRDKVGGRTEEWLRGWRFPGTQGM
jgi:hypothetical protein